MATSQLYMWHALTPWFPLSSSLSCPPSSPSLPPPSSPLSSLPPRAIRDDIEAEDDHESYFKAVANAPIVVGEGEEDIELEYDSDGNPVVPEKSKVSTGYVAYIVCQNSL